MTNDRNGSDRYARGWRNLQAVDAEAGKRVIEGLQDIAPDLGRYIVEFAFGDVYDRPGLDLRSRGIATIAALTALGTAAPQLRVHVNAGHCLQRLIRDHRASRLIVGQAFS